MEEVEIQDKLSDPNGLILKAKSMMSKNCSVRTSKYCDQIISMRLQNYSFDRIAGWLRERGRKYQIPAATIWRNTKHIKPITDQKNALEKDTEKFGGFSDVNPIVELESAIIIQRIRVEDLVAKEKKKRSQGGMPDYFDKRIRFEMEILNEMTRNLGNLKLEEEKRKSKVTSAELEKMTGGMDIEMNDDAKGIIKQMLLSGDIKLKRHADPNTD